MSSHYCILCPRCRSGCSLCGRCACDPKELAAWLVSRPAFTAADFIERARAAGADALHLVEETDEPQLPETD